MRPFNSRNQNWIAVHDELRRAGVFVADRPRERDGGIARSRRARSSSIAGEGASSSTFWWRRWIEQSRSPSARTSPSRGKQLHLDVVRTFDIALAEHAVVAERSLRLTTRGCERLVELRRRPHDAHAAPAAAGRRFDDEREADLARLTGRHDGYTRRLGAIRFASSLSPPARSASGGGPTQTSSAALTASAKSGFSARKP